MTKPVVVTGRMYKEEEVAELNRELATLKLHNDCCQAELMKRDKQPYPMRKAEKPDCVGLWLATDGGFYEVNEGDVNSHRWTQVRFGGAFYYLGPIPQIPKEQLPPKVVRIRDVVTGETCLAIPSFCGTSYCRISHDGTFVGVAGMGWELIP